MSIFRHVNRVALGWVRFKTARWVILDALRCSGEGSALAQIFGSFTAEVLRTQRGECKIKNLCVLRAAVVSSVFAACGFSALGSLRSILQSESSRVNDLNSLNDLNDWNGHKDQRSLIACTI